MRTVDAEVTVEGWATYYYVQCDVTKNIWSRNRWSNAYEPIPDLFASRMAAMRSTSRGKLDASKMQGFKPVVRACLFGYGSSGIKSI